MNNKKVLITGANGFIGSHLIPLLQSEGYDVYGLTRKSSSQKNIEGLNLKIRIGDLTDLESLKNPVKDMDFIIHLAGVVAAKSKEDFFRNNVDGTINLAKAVESANPTLSRFVFVSSLAACGPSTSIKAIDEIDNQKPVSFYGESKKTAEKFLLEFKDKFPITIVRPPIVYGPKDKGVFVFVQSVAKGVVPKMNGFNRNQEKYYSIVFVKDLCLGVLKMIQPEGVALSSGESFFISNFNYVTYKEIITTVSSLLNKKPVWIPVPRAAMHVLAKSMGLLSLVTRRSYPFNPDKLNEILPDYWTCNPQKAKNILGFETKTDFFTGMKETVEWYKKNKWI